MPLALQSVNGIHVASISGALDNSSGSDLVTSIKTSVEKGASIILDCTQVSHMDVGGFKQLLALDRWRQLGDGRLVLAGMSPEAWAIIVDNHCQDTFEASSSVPAAFQALGVSDQPASANDPSYDSYAGSPGYPDAPPPAAEDEYTQNFDFSSAGTNADPWAQTSAEPAAPASSSWQSNAPVDGDDPWARFQDPRAGSGSEAPESTVSGKSRLPLLIGLGVAAALLILGGIWLRDFLKVPVIEISESSIEVEEGKDLNPVEITVTYGSLSNIENIKLPDGINIIDQSGEDDESQKKIYTIEGTPRSNAQDVNVTLAATKKEGDDPSGEPVTVSIKIKEKPMEWTSIEIPPMRVGVEIIGYATIVTGAKSVSLSNAASAPGGIVIKQLLKNPESWELAGTPTVPGDFDVEFTAVSKRGASEKKSIHFKIEPPLPPSSVSVEPPVVAATTEPLKAPLAPLPSTDTSNSPALPVPPNASTPPVKQENESGEIMRTLFLERIEKAGDHFSGIEKTQLRLMVSLLTEAQMLVRVKFATGKTTLLQTEKQKLKEALEDEENRKLLNDEDCQILVVGYASPTGKPSINIRLSRGRAKTVNDLLREELGRGGDLCGDYGPTDTLSDDVLGNQAVEVFAGKIALPKELEDVAEKFKDDFNERHGVRR